MYLKDKRGQYKRQLDNFYNLMADESEVISRDIAKEVSQLKHREGRFAADISWHTRKRKAREDIGLRDFLDPEKWVKPLDYFPMTNKAKDKASMIKDCLGLSVEDISPGQIYGELMRQVGLDLDKKWASPSELKPGQKRFKYRKISDESWRYAQMYFEYKQAQNEVREQAKAEREQAEVLQADFEKERLERQFEEEIRQETEQPKPDSETTEDVLILDNGDEVVSIPLSGYKVGMRYYHLDWKKEWVGGKVIELNHAGMEGFLGRLDNGLTGYEAKLEWLRVPKRELATT
jgi:hypothetical protein